jgi:hypothetical protein
VIYWHNWKAKQFFLADFQMSSFLLTYTIQILRFQSKKNHKWIIFYLHVKEISAQIIHRDLFVIIEREAMPYFIVTKCLHHTSYFLWMDGTYSNQENQVLDKTDETTLTALFKQIFSFVRELSRLTHLSKPLVHRHLKQSLGFRVRHFR